MSIISTDNLPHTVTILKREYVTTESLAVTDTMVPKAEGVKCWVQHANMSEQYRGQKLKKKVTHKVYFNSDFDAGDIKEGDAVVVTATSTANKVIVGKAFRYQVSDDASAGLGILFKHFFEEFQLPFYIGRE